jgi:hypothetical protein
MQAPPIPAGPVTTDGEQLYWHPMAVDWWNTWADSAQAKRFRATDWMTLIMLLPLIDTFFCSAYSGEVRGMGTLLAEIRKTESNLGATVMDRRRLLWQDRMASGNQDEDDELGEDDATDDGPGAGMSSSRRDRLRLLAASDS